ncbi:MAG: hypothetical protein HFJ12_01600 [Bacilli bacterium]|nr:hypothetical protein [Bacilli bacterium]
MKGMYSKLPHSVKIKNERVTINTDFRIFIDFEHEMQGTDKRKAINKALSRFYPAFFDIYKNNLLEEAVDKFLWFYKCGKQDDMKKSNKKSKKSSQVYSYSYDDLYIWGTFNQHFKNDNGLPIDLTKDCIHWWKFRSMWLTIPEKAVYSKIKSYRAYAGEDKDMLELKEAYKLPPTEEEIEDSIRRDKIYEILK